MTSAAVVQDGGRKRDGDALWAITAYFNPLGSVRRRDNYRQFRDRLLVPLVAVELGFGGRYDLGDGDAEILVHVDDGDVMFQKERLLNLASSHVPSTCRHIAWLDSDVVFERDDWMDAAVEALANDPLVQLFSQVDYMHSGWAGGPSDGSDVYTSRQSIACAVACGGGPRTSIHLKMPGAEVPVYSRGFAWAARRTVLDQGGGLYDECILGGGDTALVSAVFEDVDRVVGRQEMSPAQEARYRAWAQGLRAAGGDRVGLVEGRLFHLWHGGMESRGYGKRHAGFRRFDFDPAADIVLGRAGAWRWNSPKEPMHAFVHDYFVSRMDPAR